MNEYQDINTLPTTTTTIATTSPLFSSDFEERTNDNIIKIYDLLFRMKQDDIYLTEQFTQIYNDICHLRQIFECSTIHCRDKRAESEPNIIDRQ